MDAKIGVDTAENEPSKVCFIWRYFSSIWFSNGAQALADSLRRAPLLQSLNLEGNVIGESGGAALADALERDSGRAGPRNRSHNPRNG